jgi:hypothetical protein
MNNTEHAKFGFSQKHIGKALMTSLLLVCSITCLGQTSGPQVLTQHNDAQRSGLNDLENLLTPTLVNSSRFGKLFDWNVRDKVYAQPLYMKQLNINGRIRRGVVFIATANNDVFAFDAHQADERKPLWERNLSGAEPDARAVDVTDVGIGPFAASVGDYKDMAGHVGIIGTPVIDPDTQTMYLVSKSKTGPDATASFRQRLHALDVLTGEERAGFPVDIAADFPGQELDVKSVFPNIDLRADQATKGRISFSPRYQNQRAALLLWPIPGCVEASARCKLLVVAWGSHNDGPPFHGWMMGFEGQSGALRGVFSTSPYVVSYGGRAHHMRHHFDPQAGGASIWQAGAGPAMDSRGGIYVMTGNGDFDPEKGNFGMSLLKLALKPSTALSTSFVVEDYFTPKDWRIFNRCDVDLGSAGPIIVSTKGKEWVVGGGKSGKLYQLPSDRLGKLESRGKPAPQFQAVSPDRSHLIPCPPAPMYHIHGQPALWANDKDGQLLYVWGEKDWLRAYKMADISGTPMLGMKLATHDGRKDGLNTDNPNPTRIMSMGPDCDDMMCMPGAMLSISSNGRRADTGIVWASLPELGKNALHAVVPGRLVAFAASPIKGELQELWRSDRFPAHASATQRRVAVNEYKFAKFAYPTIADGKVFLATFSGQVLVFGLKDPD